MKIQGQIVVELNARDFVEAADHQRRLEGLLAIVQQQYPAASLSVRERRDRARPGGRPAVYETPPLSLVPRLRGAS